MKKKQELKLRKLIREQLKKLNEGMDENKAQKEITSKLKELGILTKNFKFEPNKWIEVSSNDITKELPNIFQSLFNKINLAVEVAFNPKQDTLLINLKYKYKHESGNNGYDARYMFRDGKWKRTD